MLIIWQARKLYVFVKYNFIQSQFVKRNLLSNDKLDFKRNATHDDVFNEIGSINSFQRRYLYFQERFLASSIFNSPY